MAGIRRALLLASAERYIVLIVNLAVTVVIARLLTPSEYGLSVLGTAALGIADALRDLGVSAYLVQQQELTPAKIRTAFTVTLALTLATVGPLVMLAGPIAEFYGTPDLKYYLMVTALTFCMGPFMSPIHALMRRDMAFGKIAFIGVVTALLGAIVTISLAGVGFSYMSFAWAGLIAGAAQLFLYQYYYRDVSIFRLSLREWRSVVGFGAYDSVNTVLAKVWELAPYLILGRLLSMEAVGIYQRAYMINRLPDRTLLAGIFPVTLPALAEQARTGRNLNESYLRAIELITSVLWPSQLILVLLAYPIVLVLLGQQWREAAPLIQIMACAQLSAFTVGLNYPILVAAGAVRQTVPLTLLQVGSSVVVVTLAAMYGLYAVAFSLWLTIPFNVFLSVRLVRRHIPFRWHDLARALRKSAIVSALSALGPLMMVVVAGSFAAVTIGAAAIAMVLAAAGWLAGIWLTDHPLLQEFYRGRDHLFSSGMVAKASEGRRRFLRWLHETRAG